MAGEIDFDPERPLFLPESGLFPIGEAQEALDRAFRHERPVVIYIHGRAKGIGEPRKSVESGIYRGLAAYGVSVLGFTWDADDGGYDETRPIASAPDFDAFLSEVARFLNRTSARRPTVLAHSMGNLIVQELAKDGRLAGSGGPICENLILNASAVKVKRHRAWLETVGLAERIYVMTNPHDVVLKIAGMFRPDMLGRELRSPGAACPPTTYVDLRDLGVNHRYFVAAGQARQGSLRAFFSQALRGEAVDFGPIARAGEVDGVPVQRLLPGLGWTVSEGGGEEGAGAGEEED